MFVNLNVLVGTGRRYLAMFKLYDGTQQQQTNPTIRSIIATDGIIHVDDGTPRSRCICDRCVNNQRLLTIFVFRQLEIAKSRLLTYNILVPSFISWSSVLLSVKRAFDCWHWLNLDQTLSYDFWYSAIAS